MGLIILVHPMDHFITHFARNAGAGFEEMSKIFFLEVNCYIIFILQFYFNVKLCFLSGFLGGQFYFIIKSVMLPKKKIEGLVEYLPINSLYKKLCQKTTLKK